MAEKSIVTWYNSYSIGIPLVDAQHKELVRLTNKLYEGCFQGQEASKKAFLQTIRGVVEYVGYHFSTEEKIMLRVNYPGYNEHKKQHTDFVHQVYSEVEKFESNKPFSPMEFVTFLKDWVLEHIAITDKKMGNYLLELKQSGDLAKITVKVKEDEGRVDFH
jgi:hemerythrin